MDELTPPTAPLTVAIAPSTNFHNHVHKHPLQVLRRRRRR